MLIELVYFYFSLNFPLTHDPFLKVFRVEKCLKLNTTKFVELVEYPLPLY